MHRAIALLRCWNESSPEEGYTLSELAKKTGLHKTIVHRLLGTLAAHDIVRRDPITNRYQLGVTLVELGSLAAAKMSFRRLALPVMKQLAAETGEMVMLTVISGNDAVCVEKVDSPSPIKVSYEVGRRRPLYTGAAAKVLLAFTPEPERTRLIDSIVFVRYTDLTITNKTDLLQELEEIRRRGYALSYGEIDEGVTGIGAPVWGRTGELVCGITLVGPGTRLNPTIDACVPKVLNAAKRITLELGGGVARPNEFSQAKRD